LAKEETVLRGVINELTETGRCYGMEMNGKKTKVMRFSRQLSPVKCTVDQKQLENVEYCKYLDSIITDDERRKYEIKSGIVAVMVKVSWLVGESFG